MKHPFCFDQTTLDANKPLPALVVAYAIFAGCAVLIGAWCAVLSEAF